MSNLTIRIQRQVKTKLLGIAVTLPCDTTVKIATYDTYRGLRYLVHFETKTGSLVRKF